MKRPNSSSPITATIAVRSPRRAAPHAAIAPEPPIVRSAESISRSACPKAGSTPPPRRIRSGLQSPRTSRSRSAAGTTRRGARAVELAAEIDIEQRAGDPRRDVGGTEPGRRLAILRVLGVEDGLARMEVRRRVAARPGTRVVVVIALLDDHPVEALDVGGGVGRIVLLKDGEPVSVS